MTELVVGTDAAESSDALADYLADVVDTDDTLYVVNSLVGGEDTTGGDVQAGERAIQVVVDRMEELPVTVETHQFVRGNEPVEDLLAFAEEVDADEFVIGVHKRTPVGKVVFGSTAQNLLLAADRPVRCVPLVE
ncbi:universal stress protein [Halosimplex aquaticum]|uniref:Universal stress protein n=1 Tax=Halosimplex aquaticum TaxID=3026162 RepID=A0ABD5Y2H8_9EURY|nr:universal stress protein [Halosimplex aquaticum]